MLFGLLVALIDFKTQKKTGKKQSKFLKINQSIDDDDDVFGQKQTKPKNQNKTNKFSFRFYIEFIYIV